MATTKSTASGVRSKVTITVIDAVCRQFRQGTGIGPLSAIHGLPPQRIARILRNANLLPEVVKGRPAARPLTAEELTDRQFRRELLEMLTAANRCSIGLGHGDLRDLKRRNRSGRIDASLVDGLDDVAARMQESFPGFLPAEDPEHKLFDLLVSERWEPHA